MTDSPDAPLWDSLATSIRQERLEFLRMHEQMVQEHKVYEETLTRIRALLNEWRSSSATGGRRECAGALEKALEGCGK